MGSICPSSFLYARVESSEFHMLVWGGGELVCGCVCGWVWVCVFLCECVCSRLCGTPLYVFVCGWVCVCVCVCVFWYVATGVLVMTHTTKHAHTRAHTFMHACLHINKYYCLVSSVQSSQNVYWVKICTRKHSQISHIYASNTYIL
jgi:hypothetical protein